MQNLCPPKQIERLVSVCVCVCACTPEPLLNTQANLKHQAVLLVIICVNLPSVFEWTALSQGYRSQELLTKQYWQQQQEQQKRRWKKKTRTERENLDTASRSLSPETSLLIDTDQTPNKVITIGEATAGVRLFVQVSLTTRTVYDEVKGHYGSKQPLQCEPSSFLTWRNKLSREIITWKLEAEVGAHFVRSHTASLYKGMQRVTDHQQQTERFPVDWRLFWPKPQMVILIGDDLTSGDELTDLLLLRLWAAATTTGVKVVIFGQLQ